MPKRYRIELMAEIIVDSNQLMDGDDVMNLLAPKIVIRQYKKEDGVFDVKHFELEHDISIMDDNDEDGIIEV